MIRREGRLADRAVEFTLRRKRHLYSNERRVVTERVYELIRRERLVDHLLEQTRTDFFRLPSVHADGLRFAAIELLTNRPLSDVLRGSLPAPEDSHALQSLLGAYQAVQSAPKHETFALRTSLPEFLAEKIRSQFGDEAEALAAALNSRAPLAVRVNTLKTSLDELSTLLRKEGVQSHRTKFSPLGLILETRTNLYSLEAFKRGLFEIQDEGSQLVGILVDAPPTLIVDACAGAGGKTLQLAAQMKNRGEIFALDVERDRMDELRKRARRAGVFDVRSRLIRDDSPEDELRDLLGKADRVLVDAPCSGSGTLRRKPDARARITPEALAMHVQRQKRLLHQFAALVKPRGQLIYATCSLLREENEDVVEDFLRARPDWRLFPASNRLPLDVTNGEFLRVLPHRHNTDGFFAAVLQQGDRAKG